MSTFDYPISGTNLLSLRTPMNNFGSFNSFGNFNTFGSFSPFSTGLYSSATKKEETYDEYHARIKKEKEAKKKEYDKYEAEIKQAEDAIAPYEEAIKKSETATVKKVPGENENEQTELLMQKETMEDYKKLPWWKKALRAGGNMLRGVWKLATGLVGMEEDPATGKQKWNWKKCLKNAAIAVGCIAATCIPVVGPVITTGLLASGVVAGAIGVGKGIVKTCNAKTPDEIDKGFQDIGSGLTIGISSAVGLRGLGKGLQASASGSVTRSMGKNAVSQFFKDATVNAFRATKSAAAAQKAAVAQNGFWSTFGSNIKNVLPKFGKKKYEEALNSTKEGIDSRLGEIEQRLKDLPNQNSGNVKLEETLLKQEKAALMNQKASLSKLKTKADWENFLKGDNSKPFENVQSFKNKLDSYNVGDKVKVDIHGAKYHEYTLTENDLNLINNASTRMEGFVSKNVELANVRNVSMKHMSLSGNKTTIREVNQYTGVDCTSRLGRFWEFVRPQRATTLLGKAKNWIVFPFSMAFKAMGIMFKPWELIKKSPASAVYKIEATVVNPVYEESAIKSILGCGDQMILIQTPDGNAIPVTKENLVEIKKQVDEANKQIAEFKKKQRELGVA